MAEMSHERCSELLGDYARGRLAAGETAAIESHLASCGDCAAELRALRALLAHDDEVLSEHERARLERGVAWQIGDVIPAPRRRSRVWAKVGAGIGAAALLAIVGVGIVQLGTGGGDDSAGGGTPATAPKEANDAAKGGADTGVTNAAGAAAAAPHPTFQRETLTLSGTEVEDKRENDDDPAAFSNDHSVATALQRFGRGNGQIAAFSNAYSVADAVRLKDEYVSELAALAPSDQRDQVRDCAERVYDSTGDYSLLAAYGADARVEGRRALVLGFVWTDKPTGPLDKYMLWVWPVANCGTDAAPLNYSSGKIGKK